MEKVKIGGVKLSQELVLLHVLDCEPPFSGVSLFLRICNENRINLPFITTASSLRDFRLACCLASEDLIRVKNIINKGNVFNAQIQYTPGVGLVSVFPHKSNLRILGLLLHALGKADIPLLGMSSSISALTFITDHAQLDRAVSFLKNFFEIPLHHAPFY